MRGILIAGLLATSAAHADAPSKSAKPKVPTLAALAPAADARNAIAIGPAGEIYQPDGKGAWVRTQPGGMAEEVVGATAIGTSVVALAKNAPPFKLMRGAWTAVNLGTKARVIIGAGTRLLAAIGKSVVVLDKPEPTKLAEAPKKVGAVSAIGASAGGVVIVTDKGLMRLQGAEFKPIKKAPKSVKQLINDRWAVIDRGAIDLRTMKPFVWPSGVNIVEATVVGNDFVGVSMHGKTVELITIKAGKPAREPVPIDNAKQVVGVVADKQARVAIALRDGRIALRDGGTWTVCEVREELAAPKPGPEPAESK